MYAFTNDVKFVYADNFAVDNTFFPRKKKDSSNFIKNFKNFLEKRKIMCYYSNQHRMRTRKTRSHSAFQGEK